MKKMNKFFALMLGAVICFSACSDDDELTQEEKDAKQAKELVEQITETYTTITDKKWSYKEFQPSKAMEDASKTDDGATAKTRINDAKHALNFNMELSFKAEGDKVKPSIAMNVPEDELEAKVLTYLNEPWGFELFTEVSDSELKSYLAQFRRVIAAPLAADKLGTDEITNEETGLCVFTIALRDYSEMTYDDVILNQKKFIAGNDDKIYLNEDGTLTVESTHKDYGVSKIILEEVKN
jgi:uncharacterized Zn finger protein (UPF0148 family)